MTEYQESLLEVIDVNVRGIRENTKTRPEPSRLEIAATVLAGILSRPVEGVGIRVIKVEAVKAMKYADALIAEASKGKAE